MYLIAYKLKDLNLKHVKYESEKLALRKYKVLKMGKPTPISLSLYKDGKLIKWDGEGSHFVTMQMKLNKAIKFSKVNTKGSPYN